MVYKHVQISIKQCLKLNIMFSRSVARHEPFINPVATLFPPIDDEDLDEEDEQERQRTVSRKSSQRHSMYR